MGGRAGDRAHALLGTLAHGSRWPWPVVIVVLLGTGASNQLEPEWRLALAVPLAAAAVLPAVLALPPTVALLGSGLATGAYFAAGFADGPVFLALPAVTLVVGSRHPIRGWRGPAAAALLVALAGLAFGAPRDIAGGGQGLWQTVGLLGLTVAAGAAAMALRSRQDASRDRAERAATEERLRMAQDLHDGVGHGLAVIAMQAGVGLHVLDRDPAKVRESLEAIRATSTAALDALRAELSQMSGGPAARRPAPGPEDLAALVDRVRAAGLRVEVVGSPGAVGDETGRVVYSVVQEALTNVLRHARATCAVVTFDRESDALVLTVRDDGVGDTGGVGGSGMGIGGMRTRVESLGGTFEAGPEANGFRVRAEFPG